MMRHFQGERSYTEQVMDASARSP